MKRFIALAGLAMMLFSSQADADLKPREADVVLWLLRQQMDGCVNETVLDCYNIDRTHMPSVPLSANLAREIGLDLYHFIGSIPSGICQHVAAVALSDAQRYQAYPQVSQPARQIMNEMVIIGASKVAAACNRCPPNRLWESKLGKDLAKNATITNSNAWDQLTRQCRPEPEPEIETASSDDFEVQCAKQIKFVRELIDEMPGVVDQLVSYASSRSSMPLDAANVDLMCTNCPANFCGPCILRAAIRQYVEDLDALRQGKQSYIAWLEENYDSSLHPFLRAEASRLAVARWNQVAGPDRRMVNAAPHNQSCGSFITRSMRDSLIEAGGGAFDAEAERRGNSARWRNMGTAGDIWQRLGVPTR